MFSVDKTIDYEVRMILFFSVKQQVMIYHRRSSLSLVSMQTPSFLLMRLNYFTDLFMMPNLNTDPLFQFFFTLIILEICDDKIFHKKGKLLGDISIGSGVRIPLLHQRCNLRVMHVSTKGCVIVGPILFLDDFGCLGVNFEIQVI